MELEDLTLLSQDSVPLDLPSSFRWGPRLRRLHLNRIASPALFQLLHSSKNLVDLQLHEALNPRYLSIEVLMNALSEMAQLRSLSLHFPSITDSVFPPSPPNQRVVLPALVHLDFRGISEYLERLVLRIDAPRLRDIQVTMVDEPFLCLSTLVDYSDRIDMHKSPHQARILSSEHTITISLTRPGAPTCVKLRLLSEQLSYQLSVVIPIFLSSAYLLNVEDLCISMTRPPSREDSLCSGLWSTLINSLTSIKWLHLDGSHSTDIVHALQDAYLRHKTVPPALHKLYLPHPGPHHVPLSEAVVSFMTTRLRSGYPICVEYERLCRISEQRGTGTSLCPVPLHYGLKFLKQDFVLNQWLWRCSVMTSFRTYFDNIWIPLRIAGTFSHTHAEGGNRSY